MSITLNDMGKALDKIAAALDAVRNRPPVDMAHLELAADRILAGDSPRMVAFWRDGHAKLAKHTWDALALAIGQRILTMIVTAALVIGITWAMVKGPPP
jgi:hypothetical protein